MTDISGHKYGMPSAVPKWCDLFVKGDPKTSNEPDLA